MADIVRDLLGTVQDLRKTLDKKLKEWNVEHAWVKQAITGLNSEANALKAEVTGITAAAKWGSAEVTGASAGFKLFNAEKTLFDLQEMRDKARGVDPDSLKASITAVERRVAATRTSLARTILRARTEITATRTIAEKAERDSRQALRRAWTHCGRPRRPTGGSARPRATPAARCRPAGCRTCRTSMKRAGPSTSWSDA